jgi:hypothetical protein
MRILLLLCFLLPALLGLGCAPRPAGYALSFLTANIGNTLLDCEDYAYNLCEVDVEARIREQIAALRPDVVALQEVLADWQCDDIDEDDRNRTCHADARSDEPSQVRRLLGPDYDVTCDGRNGYECYGVHTAFGAIDECASGDCVAQTPDVVDDCDPGFSVSAVDVTVAGGDTGERGASDDARFTLVNGHPASGWETECRAAQMEQAFALADGPALIGGDMNLDPWRDVDESVLVWDEHVGEGRRFHYLSGPAEATPPRPTNVSVIGESVLDHVVSDAFVGDCSTLGEAPGTTRLDGGAGMDHRAIFCALSTVGGDT